MFRRAVLAGIVLLGASAATAQNNIPSIEEISRESTEQIQQARERLNRANQEFRRVEDQTVDNASRQKGKITKPQKSLEDVMAEQAGTNDIPADAEESPVEAAAEDVVEDAEAAMDEMTAPAAGVGMEESEAEEVEESLETAVEEADVMPAEDMAAPSAAAEATAEAMDEGMDAGAEDYTEPEAAIVDEEGAVEAVADEDPSAPVPAETTPAEDADAAEETAAAMDVDETSSPVPATGAAEDEMAEEEQPADMPELVPEDDTDGVLVLSLTIEGDSSVLDDAGLRDDLERQTLGRRLDPESVSSIAKAYQDALADRGYYLASFIPVETQPEEDGSLTFRLDAGRIGTISILERGGEPGSSYRGTYYSRSQIEKRFRNMQEGDIFNYAVLYDAFYRVNAHPDLTADVDMKVKTDTEEGYRVVDLDVSVEDDLPLHGVFEVRNDGTDVTDEWQAGLTLQYLNVTKNDDILTLNIPVSVDLESIRSVSLSYYFPHEIWKGGGFSLYAGFSELNSEDIITEVGLEGDGWFVGAQADFDLVQARDYILSGAIGISHSLLNDNILFDESLELDPIEREVAVTPLNLSLRYDSLTPDAWDGLNTAMLAFTIHGESFPGASDEEEFNEQRQNATPDYQIVRLYMTRTQALMRDEDDREQYWTLFGRLEGQYSTEPLIPSEQKGVGGADTVRGYIEREFLGDSGVNGQLEYRTPLYRSSWLPDLFGKDRRDDAPAFETMQFLCFVDGAYIELADSLSGEEDSYELLSVGLGLRLSLSDYVQAKVDWGFPLEETEDSDTSGRGHFSLQVLF